MSDAQGGAGGAGGPFTERAGRISGETYFFRDQGQFDLLRLRLLPELLERRRAARPHLSPARR